jgi:hypothetical protein
MHYCSIDAWTSLPADFSFIISHFQLRYQPVLEPGWKAADDVPAVPPMEELKKRLS